MNFLREKTTASRHKKIIRNFEKRKYIAPGPFHTFAMGEFVYVYCITMYIQDLIDYSMKFRQNQGYRYILLAVDIFSKKMYVRPLKVSFFVSSLK